VSTSVVASRIRERLRRSVQPAEAPRPSLNEIGLATGTDKASTVHDYLGVYERNLGHLRDRDFLLVEIGVHQGASVKMWESFFSRARIIGVDINASCRRFRNDRIRIRIGDQGNPELLQSLARRRPLVVIDDGSHQWHHQVQAFRAFWPHLPPGGVFIIEDIHTSFGRYKPVYGKAGGPTGYDFIAEIAAGVVGSDFADPAADDFEAYCRSTIDSLVFLRHAVIIHKKRYRQPRFEVGSVQDQPGRVWSTDVGTAYDRIPTEVVGADARITGLLERLAADSPVPVEPAWSGLLQDITVYGAGPAATSERVLLDETLNCARNIRRTSGLFRTDEGQWVLEQKRAPLEMPPRPDGRTRVLLKQTWDANYGHWMIDALPKIGLLEGQLDLADCAFVVNEREEGSAMRRVVLDSLALAGVAEEQVEFLWQGQAHRFAEIVVPGTISRHPVTKTPFAIRFLESLAEQVEAGEQKRIYLSRNGGDRRRLVNEDAVMERLAPLGYHLVRPETLSLREQIALFKGATHVIGNMGAALTNLAFSPAGVSVLTLATQTMPHDYFYDILCHKEGARYRGLQGRAVGDEKPGMGSDFEVDLELLDQSLEWLHQEVTPQDSLDG
jgi:capsular polysaccharide biosynthesis protein